MAGLITSSNLSHPDDIYQKLIDLHEGCDEAESRKRNAKLILILANHIGDPALIAEAIDLAASTSPTKGTD